MIKKGELYFNGRTSLDLNLKMLSYPSIPQSNEEYEKVDVEGRNGSLYINKGTYPDKEIPFEFDIRSSDNIDVDLDKILDWLTNITDNRLIFGRKDRCYRVKKVDLGNFKQKFTTYGNINITFICEPFAEDLESTIINIHNEDVIFYHGTVEGFPLIKVIGSGDIQVAINSEAIVIKDVNEYVEIDSELLQVRNKDGTSKDMDTLGDFPTLKNGVNTIFYSGNVSKLEIEYKNKYL